MSGIWRSTDGTSWTNITPSGFPSVYGRIVIGIAPSNENVAYFLVQGTNGTNGSDQINAHQFWKYSYLTGDGSGSNGTWVNRGVNLPNESGLSGNARFDSQGGYDMLGESSRMIHHSSSSAAPTCTVRPTGLHRHPIGRASAAIPVPRRTLSIQTITRISTRAHSNRGATVFLSAAMTEVCSGQATFRL
jgi:hypothetical protein